ncbi:MAG: YbhB/YbcL family Raf kinase inhibitor-like protein [Sedimentisphaerales bacterium]|nr:YbhB/YbcL family Raf kinase inhibitor-like protein [Sedimentisphaerales bacterium]
MEIKITSSAFEDGDLIPAKYTCDGQDISPPLQWQSVPESAKTIALICDDPDAPMGTFVHWVLFNLPAEEAPRECSGREDLAERSQTGFYRFWQGWLRRPVPTQRYTQVFL